VPVALALAHLLRSVLFGIQPYDPVTLIGSILLRVPSASVREVRNPVLVISVA